MKKEEFVKLGIDEETAKKLEEASLEELKSYIPKTRFDEVNNERKKLELDVRERDTQLETLKNSTGDVETLKQQIETLQNENTAKDEAHATEIRKLQREAVDTELLTAASAKNAKAVLGLFDSIDDTVDIDSYKTKRTEQLEAIKRSDSYLFDTKSTTTKVKGAVPGETGKDDGNGKVDTSKMTYSELVAYMAENPDVTID